VPVGLTFSAKERLRSDALVNFGEPIRVADFLAGYPDKKHDCIGALTKEIKERIEALILHLPRLERARVVDAVKRLYLDRLLVGNRVIHEPVPPQTGELLLTQAMAAAVDYTYAHHPERAARFINRLNRYERWLRRLRLSDEELARFSDRSRLVGHSLLWSLLAVILAPLALYGWLHCWLPALITGSVIRRSAGLSGTPRTHVSTAAILAGVLGFGLLYGGFIAGFHALFGWPASLWYGLSLPVTTLVAHYYGRELRRFAAGLRTIILFVRTPGAGRRMMRLRSRLIAEIEAARWLVPDEALRSKPNDY
jgi:glycerol-3-phosphate O-acyltransferase / dihydroxyacetone phosphate acyltransferase